jgi:3-polyprenyl-4-hydroxybenzoate decarboxylase
VSTLGFRLLSQSVKSSEVLFRLYANTDSQCDCIFTKGPTDVLDHATSEIAVGSKLGIDATKKCPAKVSNAPGHRSSRRIKP